MRDFAETARFVIPACWAIWAAGWLLAAFGTKRTQWREPIGTAIWNRAPALLGAIMLLRPQRLPPVLTQRFIPPRTALLLAGMGLTLLGLLFAAWARWYLGRNWSGTVTVKEGHTLIVGGPYRWVRHPIYSGILAALVGTALVIGAAYGFIATALVLAGFIVKLRVEEARMRATFPGAYDGYCRRTARLLPGVY